MLVNLPGLPRQAGTLVTDFAIVTSSAAFTAAAAAACLGARPLAAAPHNRGALRRRHRNHTVATCTNSRRASKITIHAPVAQLDRAPAF